MNITGIPWIDPFVVFFIGLAILCLLELHKR
jgi:hypothetical protein